MTCPNAALWLPLVRGRRVAAGSLASARAVTVDRPLGPAPTGSTLLPDVPHWAWHEYGNRVGFWRMKAVLDRLKITPSLSVNARVCEDYPRIAKACLDAGWEFMGHCVTNAVRINEMPPEQEKQAIHETQIGRAHV